VLSPAGRDGIAEHSYRIPNIRIFSLADDNLMRAHGPWSGEAVPGGCQKLTAAIRITETGAAWPGTAASGAAWDLAATAQRWGRCYFQTRP
jgi:hypothetical protein